VVISNNSTAEALTRARQTGVPGYHLSSTTHPAPAHLDAAILQTLRRHAVDLVILAGYLRKIGPQTLSAYQGAILNLHPALLPAFGGPGMYGRQVHAAVLAAGVPETGATIHVIDATYDTGPIVAQRRIPVLPDDTVDRLAQRVLAQEHQLLMDTLRQIVAGTITLPCQTP
jgi:phosphoribosylglycinamide formyltransferase-1